eukprot:scaffold2518_cov178-Amphora_coffeaeformis.AAC.10
MLHEAGHGHHHHHHHHYDAHNDHRQTQSREEVDSSSLLHPNRKEGNHDTLHQQQQPREHANQQSMLLGLGNREWMGQPYTYNASPMSWFQRYYRHHLPSSYLLQHSNSYHRDHNYTSSGSLPDIELNDDENNSSQRCARCIDVLCGSFCTLLCCCGCLWRPRRKDDHTTMAANPNEGDGEGQNLFNTREFSSSRQTSASRYMASSGFCLVFILTILLPMILLRSSSGDHTWDLNPGESHRISPAFLNKEVSIATNGEVGVRVYAIKGHCPALSGRPLNLSDKQTIRLQREEYDYMNFYLNKGSTIDVEITNSTGSVNVYLLQGRRILQDVQESSFNPDSHEYLQKQFVSSSNEKVKLKLTVETTDIYTLLYDNVNEGLSQISVSYKINLATYDLSHRTPKCAGGKSHSCILSLSLVPFFEGQCLLVQAESSPSLNDIVTVHITQHRRYGMIVFLSLLPILVYSVCPCCYQDRDRTLSYEQIHDSSPLGSLSGSLPPALSPNYHDYPTLRKYPSPVPPPVGKYPSPIPPPIHIHVFATGSSAVDEINAYPVATDAEPLLVNSAPKYQY